MTPQEKAKELVDRFWCIGESDGDSILNWEESKQCAIVCVEEIQKELIRYDETVDDEYGFWNHVKREIEKLL